MRYLSLAVVLAAIWLTFSGHTEALIVGMGAASVALVVWLAYRMDLVDEEGVPVDAVHRAAPYSAWLIGEIVKSNIAMFPVLLSKEPEIQPQVIKLPVGDSRALGQVTYANSITMTPGTVTLEVSENEVTVHALTDAAAAGLRSGAMERRALRVGGRPATKEPS
ncbi:MAG: Na+/H+ antiporter subunit E [Planctomycetota bacterium]